MNDKQIILTARIVLLAVGTVLVFVFWPTTGPERTPRPERTAVREAVQYALIYSQSHDGFLPGSLPSEAIRAMERYPAEIEPDRIEYLIGEGIHVRDVGADTAVASITVIGGRYVGYSGGYVLFEDDQSANKSEMPTP